MNLHAVKARVHGVACGLHEILHCRANLLRAHGTGSDGVFKSLGGKGLGVRVDGGGRDGELAAMEVRVGDTPYVPELDEDVPALVVDGFGDLAPALDLGA